MRQTSQGAPDRILALDIARSAALVTMAIYHFAFDLEMFGYLARGTAFTQPLRGLALGTASSFLALAGVSLVLAHGAGIRWRGFWRRWGMIAVAALVISLGSYLWQPGAYIFFGILHAIAACSLLGLLVLRLPAVVLAGLAAAAFVLPEVVTTETRALLWAGLTEPRRPSLDYVPLLPWAAAFLAGMALGRIGVATGLWPRLARAVQGPVAERLAWPGQHSLAIYLLHQPVLIALIAAASWISRGV